MRSALRVQQRSPYTVVGRGSFSSDQFLAFGAIVGYPEFRSNDYIIGASVRSTSPPIMQNGTALLASNNDGFMSVCIWGRYVEGAASGDLIGANNNSGGAGGQLLVVRGVRNGWGPVTSQFTYYYNSTITYATGVQPIPDGIVLIGRSQRNASQRSIGAVNIQRNGPRPVPSLTSAVPTNDLCQIGLYIPSGPGPLNYQDQSGGAGGTTGDSTAFTLCIR